MKTIKMYFFLILFFSILNSCDKDVANSTDYQELKNRYANTSVIIEPDYDYYGKSLYEYMNNYRGIITPAEFFYPSKYSFQISLKMDSLLKDYENLTQEQVLSDLESKGYISKGLKQLKSELYDDLINRVSEVESYLDEKFISSEQELLSPYEKILFKSEIVGLKYLYRYISEINRSEAEMNEIQLRGPGDDCDRFNWTDILKNIAAWTGAGTVIGGAIGTIFFPAAGTAIGGAVGVLSGLEYGIIYELAKAIKSKKFCKECIPNGVSKELTELCDGSAFFKALAGSHAYKFKWNAINGNCQYEWTLPGQKNLIKQSNPDAPLLVQVTSYCHIDEDTDLTLQKSFGPYNLFEEQEQIPYGTLFFNGETSFVFEPGPNDTDNFETYSVSKTVTYDLSGLAIIYPNKYSIVGIVDSQNAQNISLIGNKLTVTWKVDSPEHWLEFLESKTYGTISLLVQNMCPGGETRTFELKVLIQNSNQNIEYW